MGRIVFLNKMVVDGLINLLSEITSADQCTYGKAGSKVVALANAVIGFLEEASKNTARVYSRTSSVEFIPVMGEVAERIAREIMLLSRYLSTECGSIYGGKLLFLYNELVRMSSKDLLYEVVGGV